MDGAGCSGMRARITQTLDVTGCHESVAVAGNAAEVQRLVGVWLRAFADAQKQRRADEEAE